MTSFFELAQARSWALYTLKDHNVNIHLNLSHITDPALEWFLQEIPQSYGSVMLNMWNSKRVGDHLVFSRDGNKAENTDVYIQFFSCEKSRYVGLYHKDGKRMCDICLVIWNCDRPHVTNPGFAPGRCPDFLASVINQSST